MNITIPSELNTIQENISDFSIPIPNYTMVPNILFDHWMSRLNPAAFMILMFICRRTFGWHKKVDRISKNQICISTGLSKNTAQTAIEELEDHRLIIKYQERGEYGYLPNQYSLNIHKPEISEEEFDQNLGRGRSKIDPGVGQKLTQGVGQKLTPQKKDINKKIKKESIPPPSFSEKKEEKISFGDYVRLKPGEYEKLKREVGDEYIDHYIVSMNDYVPNAKPYKDYAAAIRQWHRRDLKNGTLPKLKKETPPDSPSSPPSESQDINVQRNKKISSKVIELIGEKFSENSYFKNCEYYSEIVSPKINKIYKYYEISPEEYKNQLIRDLEYAFPGSRDILMPRREYA